MRKQKRGKSKLIFKCMKRYPANCYNIVEAYSSITQKRKFFLLSVQFSSFIHTHYQIVDHWHFMKSLSRNKDSRETDDIHNVVCVSRYKMQLQDQLSATLARNLCAHDSFMVRPNLCHNKIFSKIPTIIQNQPKVFDILAMRPRIKKISVFKKKTPDPLESLC